MKGQRSACPYLILAVPFPRSVGSYLNPLCLRSSYLGSGEMDGTRPLGLTSDVSTASSQESEFTEDLLCDRCTHRARDTVNTG